MKKHSIFRRIVSGFFLFFFIFMFSVSCFAISAQNMKAVKQIYEEIKERYPNQLAIVKTRTWSAHRGYSDLAPENTEAAYILACLCGAKMLEGDVKASSDGVPYMIHSDLMSHYTDMTKSIYNYSSAQLEKINITKGNNIAMFSGLKLCTFQRYLQICKQYGCYAMIDLKSIPKSIAAKAMKNISQIIAAEGMKDKCIIATFYHPMAMAYREVDKTVRIIPCYPADEEATAQIRAQGNTITFSQWVSHYTSDFPSRAGIKRLSKKDEYTSRVVIAKAAKRSVSKASVSAKNVTYNGKEQTPKADVLLDGEALEKEKHYKIEYKKNVNAGTASFTITGTGDYKDKVTGTFEILPKSLSGASVKVQDAIYTGKELKPVLSVALGKVTLAEGKDFTVSCKNNINAGTASFTVTGKGNYKGSVKGTFLINPKNIKGAVASVEKVTYARSEQTPVSSVKVGSITLRPGKDYTVSYANNINAGTASYVITGKGNYTGTVTGSFVIGKRDIEGSSISCRDVVYTGKAQKPDVVVKRNGRTLISGNEYTVSYKNNVNAGTASFTVSGKGNFTGSITGSFNIKQKPIDKALLSVSDVVYDGKEKKPEVKVTLDENKLKEGVDFTVSFQKNTNAGTAFFTVSGTGNYGGSLRGTFLINPKSIKNAVIFMEKVTYARSEQTPVSSVKVRNITLRPGKDYTISYANNINAGTASYIITGRENYTGTVTGSFVIEKRDIEESSISCKDAVYTGKAQKPDVVVKRNGRTLIPGSEYTVSYKNNVNAGTASFTVTGKGNFTGSITGTFSIKQKSIKSASFSVPDVVFDGREKKPVVKITLDGKRLKEGTDFTVSFRNNTKVGTASYIVTGKGNYNGSAKGEFMIMPRKR